jgi:2-oxo-4-hydroxy-4-carboxy-5-ureidoimidazoline decarboxylase
VLRDRFQSVAVKEQGQVAEASDATLSELADLNQAYLQRFGFIFIISAKGLSAETMLQQLRISVTESQDAELLRASEQQEKIIQSRLMTWAP